MIDQDKSYQLYQTGRAAMDRGQYEEAISDFEESVRVSPHFKTLELLGECLLQKNRLLEAIVPLAAAIGLGTNEFRACYLLAEVYSRMEERRLALEFADRALSMKPDFKRARELKEKLGVS